MCIDDWVYFLRCRANSRRCLRRCLAFGCVARCCSRRNARLSCGADNGGRNTFPHTISPFTPFNSVLLRSGAFRFLKPDCVAWLLLNNFFEKSTDIQEKNTVKYWKKQKLQLYLPKASCPDGGMADTEDLKSSSERSAGSIPAPGTSFFVA